MEVLFGERTNEGKFAKVRANGRWGCEHPHCRRGFTARPRSLPFPLSSKAAGYAGKNDKDPNNALDPNNSEVQLIETIIKGIAHLIYLSPLNSEITFWELFFPGVNNLFYNMKTLCIKDKSQA